MKKSIIAATVALMAANTAYAVEVTPNLDINGEVFVGAKYMQNIDSAGTDTRTSNINVERAEMSATYATDDIWSATFGINAKSSGNISTVSVKKAFIEADVSEMLNVRLGAAETPMVKLEDSLWGFRHISKGLSQLNGYTDASDYGVHLAGETASDSEFNFGYALSAIKGTGYESISQNSAGNTSYDIEGVVSLIGLDGSVSFVFKRDYLNTPTNYDNLWGIIGKTNIETISVGAEYLKTTSVSGNVEKAYSLFANTNNRDGYDGYDCFARYDVVDKNSTTNNDEVKTLLTGIEYSYNEKASTSLSVSQTIDSGLNTRNRSLNVVTNLSF